MNNLDETINSCAESVAEYVRETTYVDVLAIKTIISQHFSRGMSRILTAEVRDLTDKQNSLIHKMNFGTRTPRERARLNEEIRNVAAKRKIAKRTLAMIDNDNELRELRKWVRIRYGDDAMEEFFSQHPELCRKKKSPKVTKYY